MFLAWNIQCLNAAQIIAVRTHVHLLNTQGEMPNLSPWQDLGGNNNPFAARDLEDGTGIVRFPLMFLAHRSVTATWATDGRERGWQG